MSKRRAAGLAVESLEGRLVMSTTAVVAPSALHHARVVAAEAARAAATHTTLSVHAGTLGQPITITATVRAAASAGSPTGSVSIVDHGKVLGTLSLTPTEPPLAPGVTPKVAYSVGTVTLTPKPGGASYFFGRHALSAVFNPSGTFAKSTGNASFTVAQPSYSTLPDGVKVATVVEGAGAGVQAGQSASVLYSGYLAKNGRLFDDSINDGGVPLTFKVGAGDVVPGFDAGVAGMKVGETRILSIPAAEGYGKVATGPIPANSDLVFVVTLESIS